VNIAGAMYMVVKVEQDRDRVDVVGNVSISYDRYDRVERIGSVQMSYNRYALERVGGLEIIYNRRGQIVDTYGLKGGRNMQIIMSIVIQIITFKQLC
jgi:hypothetical protein